MFVPGTFFSVNFCGAFATSFFFNGLVVLDAPLKSIVLTRRGNRHPFLTHSLSALNEGLAESCLGVPRAHQLADFTMGVWTAHSELLL